MGSATRLWSWALLLLCGPGPRAAAAAHEEVAHAAQAAVGPDVLAQATFLVKRRLLSKRREIKLASKPTCDFLAQKMGAMSCSMVSQISGQPEGCECRLEATSCPPPEKELGFTGVSPSMPLSAATETVTLCMYWQWLEPAPAQGPSESDKGMAEQFIAQAHFNAAASVKPMADAMLAATPAPVELIPPTPQPLPWEMTPPPVQVLVANPLWNRPVQFNFMIGPPR